MGKFNYKDENGIFIEVADKEEVPVNLSDLTDDSSHRTVTDAEKSKIAGAVVFNATQSLTTDQKSQARANIGAGTSDFSGSYNDLSNKPQLQTVATTGNYNDLNNKPTIPSIQGLATVQYVDDADSNLQSQIDAITSQSDVVDIVATKAALNAYSKPIYKDDIVKVLADESQGGAITYYRCGGNVEPPEQPTPPYTWVYIGSQGPYYTKSEADAKFQDKTSVINVTLQASGWSNNQQTITNSSIVANGYDYIVAPDPTSFEAYGAAKIYALNVTSDSHITFVCGTVPTTNLTVRIMKVKVS